MNFVESLEYIYKFDTGVINLELEELGKLCDAIGNPQHKVKIIHIAGTNGKGSVSVFLEAGLINNNYVVGRYTSPYVLNYRESYTINSNIISEQEFAALITEIEASIKGKNINPSPFEIETAAAFLWFKNRNVDIAIIETGMGGRLDATNIANKDNKLVSIITPIAIDHTKFLGKSLTQIAYEKAGIINNIAISAIQDEDVKNVLIKNSKSITFVNKASNIRFGTTTLYDYKNLSDIEISLLGKHQVNNSILALECLKYLNSIGYKINIHNKIFINAIWKCRFEKINDDPIIILDGAHNPQGAKALAENIDIYFKGKSIAYIVGILADKDYNNIAKITSKHKAHVYTITPNNSRGLESHILKSTYLKYTNNVKDCGSLNIALKEALNSNVEVIIIFGSLSIMQECYKYFKKDIY